MEITKVSEDRDTAVYQMKRTRTAKDATTGEDVEVEDGVETIQVSRLTEDKERLLEQIALIDAKLAAIDEIDGVEEAELITK